MGNGVNLLQQALQAQIARRQQAAMYDSQMQAQQAGQQRAEEGQQQGLAAQLQAGLMRQQMDQAQHQQDFQQRQQLQSQGESAAQALHLGGMDRQHAGRMEEDAARAAAQAAIQKNLLDWQAKKDAADNASREKMAGTTRHTVTTRVGGGTAGAPMKPKDSPEYLQMAQDAKILAAPNMFLPAQIEAAKQRYAQSAAAFGDRFGLMGGAPPAAAAPRPGPAAPGGFFDIKPR